MRRIQHTGLSVLTSVALAALATACGGAEAADTEPAADPSSDSEIVEACTIVPPTTFVSFLGDPVNTMGDATQMGSGWYSNCWFTGTDGLYGARLYLMLNSTTQPPSSSAELGDVVAAQFADPENGSITPPAPVDGFSEPAVSFFHDLMGLHGVIVQHGSYSAQLFAPTLEMATEAMHLVLEHAP